MAEKLTLEDRLPEVVAGLPVEKWLRVPVSKTILGQRYLPNGEGELSDAINQLNERDRHKVILHLSNAYANSKTQTDFFGMIGLPLGIGLITIAAGFGISLFAMAVYGILIAIYLFAYYRYRLMQAALESILAALKIPTEY